MTAVVLGAATHDPSVTWDDFFIPSAAKNIKAGTDVMESLLRNPGLYAIDDLINGLEPRENGRAMEFPIWPALVFEAAKYVYKSNRRVAAEFRDGALGKLCFEVVREMMPNRPDLWMPNHRFFTRHHYDYRAPFLDRHWRVIQEALNDNAAALAEEMGLCQGTTKGSTWTTPAEEETMVADGVVIAPFKRTLADAAKAVELSKGDKERFKKTLAKANAVVAEASKLDPSIGRHVTGGGSHVIGSKALIFATRNSNLNERLITGIGLQYFETEGGGEPAAAVNMFAAITPRYPLTRALCFDGAYEGVHLSATADEGTLPVVPTPQSPEFLNGLKFPFPVTVTCKDGSKRVINDVDLETGEVLGPAIMTRLGAPHVVTTIANGTEVLVPCPSRSVQPSHGVFYKHCTVPAGSGIPAQLVGAKFMLRLNESDADRAKNYNRCRHLRPITVLDENFDDLYGRRNDTESGNAQLKAALPNNRAHVKGPTRLMTALLAYQLLKNSVAVETYRRRRTNEAFSPPLAA